MVDRMKEENKVGYRHKYGIDGMEPPKEELNQSIKYYGRRRR